MARKSHAPIPVHTHQSQSIYTHTLTLSELVVWDQGTSKQRVPEGGSVGDLTQQQLHHNGKLVRRLFEAHSRVLRCLAYGLIGG